MSEKFKLKPFAEINLKDPFFDPLKMSYPEFESKWFPKGISENREALVFEDEYGLGAFIALKIETEKIVLEKCVLPEKTRIKICTLRLAERFRGQRLGEGALGLILWYWQRSQYEEIYITVFSKHEDLIQQLIRFGFSAVGHNDRGELVYMRSRRNIDFSDPYKSFPFISPTFSKGGYLIIDDYYHDTMFPYSELKYVFQEQLDLDVANGISKIYIGKQWDPHYQKGEPLFIYRKYNGPGAKRYKSCLTSYCVVTDVIAVKRNNNKIITFEKFKAIVGNKSVFSEKDLKNKYENDKNITIIKMLYCGYFGSGNNINLDWLVKNELWCTENEYPANIQLSLKQCSYIWNAGKIDIDNVLGR